MKKYYPYFILALFFTQSLNAFSNNQLVIDQPQARISQTPPQAETPPPQKEVPNTETPVKSEENFNYPDYYYVHSDAVSQNLNLLNFDHIEEKFPMPAEPYNRDKHFGGWLRDNTPESCLNTRGKVLIRDSSEQTTLTDSGCTVDRGNWPDPYTAKNYTRSSDIQIDHVVPLKNAYMTGGHQWDFLRRCLYANYMGNSFHLLSVFGKENLKKSDKTPADYLPPNKNYTCQFVKTWLTIKLIWSLRVTPTEQAAIVNIKNKNNCADESFEVSNEYLSQQHQFINDNANLCNITTRNVFIEKF